MVDSIWSEVFYARYELLSFIIANDFVSAGISCSLLLRRRANRADHAGSRLPRELNGTEAHRTCAAPCTNTMRPLAMARPHGLPDAQ